MRDTSPVLLKFELMSAADDSQYYVHDRVEIAAILRSIMQKNTLLSLYFDEGNAFIVTAILAVDDRRGRIILDRGPDARANARLLQATRLICVTSVDKVKIQFVCSGADTVEQDGREAFALPMPEKLLRLQRREYFRLTTPVINPLKCKMKVKTAGEIREMELNIADISCGGLATNSSTALPVFDPTTRFESTVGLGDNESLQVLLELRNTFEVTLANGRKLRRCGYQFIDLSEKGRQLVQRYIMQQQQRAQRGRVGGLA